MDFLMTNYYNELVNGNKRERTQSNCYLYCKQFLIQCFVSNLYFKNRFQLTLSTFSVQVLLSVTKLSKYLSLLRINTTKLTTVKQQKYYYKNQLNIRDFRFRGPLDSHCSYYNNPSKNRIVI